MLEVAEITLREYRDGIYPQDLQLIRQYIAVLRDRAGSLGRQPQVVARDAGDGLPHPVPGHGDELALEQAEIALQEAKACSSG